MFKRITEIHSDIKTIFAKKYLTTGKKFAFASSYIGIILNRFLDGRILQVKKQKFLSFVVAFDDFSDFYWTFREIFLEDDYYFESKKKTPTVIDCGGNIGMSALYFKYLYPNASVKVFEALPENIEILEKNIASNKLSNIEVIPKAVGAEAGELKMYGDKRAATICEGMTNGRNKSEMEQFVQVEVVKLSDYIKEDIDFLKMDIEGAEGGVIDELAKASALGKIKQITMEYHSMQGKNNLLSKIISNLESASFKVSFVNGVDKVIDLKERSFSYTMLVAKAS